MTFDIALLLIQDGISNGAIYALLALAMVLVYTVSRVIFFPQGDFVVYGALTMAVLEDARVPGTVWLIVVLGAIIFVLDSVEHIRARSLGDFRRSFVAYLVAPGIIAALTMWMAPLDLPKILRMALAVLIVFPLGPMVYRLAFRRVANASGLVLIIVAVATHFVLNTLGLGLFGTEGYRTQSLSSAQFNVGSLVVSAQSIVVICVSLILMVGLYAFFTFTIAGKALHATAVNRLGAKLVGISPNRAGSQSFALAAGIGAISGILISPITTIYYDSGLLISLKGIVGAVVAGLASYPIAAAAALGVGVLESLSSYWSSAYQEVIVFMLIIPVLLIRSVSHGQQEDGE